MFLVGLCFRRRDSQTDKTRPLDAQPSSGAERSEILLRPISVCLCADVGVCESPLVLDVNVCVCVRECVYVRGWDVGTGSRATHLWPGKRQRKLWIGGGARAPWSSFKPQSNLTLLTGYCNCDSDGECSSTGTVTGTTRHSRTRSDSLFLVRDPTWPSAVHYTIHQTCLGPPQTTDQVLGNQSAPCFERGGRHLRYEVSRLWDRTSLAL